MKKLPLLVSVLAVAGLGMNSCNKSSSSTEEPTLKDTLQFSFVIMGDSRVNEYDRDSVQFPAATNTEEVNQSWKEIASLDPSPDFVMVNGDQSLGHVNDTNRLQKECLAYISDYMNSPLHAKSSIAFYVMPGNHELLTVDSHNSEHPWEPLERVWQRCFLDYVAGSNGPHAGGPDSLVLDESHMTYSFNHKGVHFTVINTDTYNGKTMGYFPIHWVTTDIQNARQSNPKGLIFVINHRPAYGYPGSDEPPTGSQENAALWQVMETNHCIAMISSHQHLFFKEQINSKVWQIVTGIAGAELDKTLPDSLQYFGYTIFEIMSSGNVIEKTMGRNVPKAGYLAPPDSPTTLRDLKNIAW